MPRKLSDEQISKIKEFRRKGLSTRSIAERLQVAPATVFYYCRDVEIKENIHEDAKEKAARLKIRKKTAELLEKAIGKGFVRAYLYRVDGLQYALVCLGFVLVCPHCGAESRHVWLCVDSGDFFCLDCRGSIDIKTVPRKKELASLT